MPSNHMAQWGKHQPFGDLFDSQWVSKLNHHIKAKELSKIWDNSHCSITMCIRYGSAYKEEHKMTATECDLSVLQCPSWPNEFQRLPLYSSTPRVSLWCEFQYLTINTDTVTEFRQSAACISVELWHNSNPTVYRLRVDHSVMSTWQSTKQTTTTSSVSPHLWLMYKFHYWL